MRLTTLLLLGALGALGAQEPDGFEVPPALLKGVQRESARLGWSPQVGAARQVRASSRLVLTQELGHAHEGEQEIPPIVIQNDQVLSLEVAAVGSEHVDVRCTLERLALSIGGTGREQRVDTEADVRSGNPSLDIFADLVGEPYRVRFGRRGQVQRIADADDLYRRLRAKTPFEDLDLRATIDAERYAQELQPLFVEFPEVAAQELKPGQRWAVRRALGVAGGDAFQGAATYVYLGIAEHGGRKCAKLAARFVLERQEQEDPGPNGVRELSGAGDPYALYVSLDDGAVLGCAPQHLVIEVVQVLLGEEAHMTLDSTVEVEVLAR